MSTWNRTECFPFEPRAGGPFLYWFGAQPRICLLDYESVRQVLFNKSGHFFKNDAHPTILALLGKGLILVEGTDWVRHRRVVNPAFAMDKLKVIIMGNLLGFQLISNFPLVTHSQNACLCGSTMKMTTTTMVSCAEPLIKEWERLASGTESREVEVEFSKQFQDLTADIISHTAFGSSYKEGKEVFHTQRQLLALAMATLLNVQLPGFKQVNIFISWAAVILLFLYILLMVG